MSKGFVYILTNPAMPGIVKIGRTERDPERRAAELFQTGVPLPFVILHSVYTFDCVSLEAEIHRHFAERRINESREFFALDADQVQEVLDLYLKDQFNALLREMMEGHTIVEEPFRIDESAAILQARELGVHPFHVVAAYEELTAEELRPALARYREKLEAKRSARLEVAAQ